MCGFFAGDEPAEWVIGQIDYRSEKRIFGAHAENQAFGNWRYRNGVYGVVATFASAGMVGAIHHLVGTEGAIQVGVHEGPLLRVRGKGSTSWEIVDTAGEGLHSPESGPDYHERGIADLVDTLLTGREPELSARKALNATEIIFAIYESSRRRARIDLPLTIADNPLVSMIEAGDLQPAPVEV